MGAIAFSYKANLVVAQDGFNIGYAGTIFCFDCYQC